MNLDNPNVSLTILAFTFLVSWVLTLVGAFPLLLVIFFALLYMHVIVVEKHEVLVKSIIYMNLFGMLGGGIVLFVSTNSLWSAL